MSSALATYRVRDRSTTSTSAIRAVSIASYRCVISVRSTAINRVDRERERDGTRIAGEFRIFPNGDEEGRDWDFQKKKRKKKGRRSRKSSIERRERERKEKEIYLQRSGLKGNEDGKKFTWRLDDEDFLHLTEIGIRRGIIPMYLSGRPGWN